MILDELTTLGAVSSIVNNLQRFVHLLIEILFIHSFIYFIYSYYQVEDSWKDMITFHQGVLLESISTYKSYIKILEGLGGTNYSQKKPVHFLLVKSLLLLEIKNKVSKQHKLHALSNIS